MQIGFFGLLTIIFITLKLCGVISWSWWLVLSPLIAGIIFTLILVIIAVIFAHKKNKW